MLTYSLSSALLDIPKSDFEINFAFRARSVWHFESDRGDIRRLVTAVAITSLGCCFVVVFKSSLILRVLIRVTSLSDFVR